MQKTSTIDVRLNLKYAPQLLTASKKEIYIKSEREEFERLVTIMREKLKKASAASEGKVEGVF